MNAEQLADVLEKTAGHLNYLERENTALRGELRQASILSSQSGESFSKIAEESGVDPSDLLETFESFTPQQREVLEKISADGTSTLGGLSDFSDNEVSAEDKLTAFLLD